MQKILDVHIGEVKVAKNGEMLKAVLGSCVGFGIIWRERKICGLAHCFLPETSALTFEIGGKFVDQAVQSLLILMRITPKDYSSLEVIIVGGGNMMKPGALRTEDLVGTNNFRVAIREAESHGFNVVYSDGLGESGRKIYINAEDFTFRVLKIPRLSDAV